MEQYNKAEDYFLQALTVYRQISQGADSVDIADTLYNLGYNYAANEQYKKAEEYYLQAQTVYIQLSQKHQVKRSMETSAGYLHETRPTESNR